MAMQFDLTCTCGRRRGGIAPAQGGMTAPAAKHPCPYAFLVRKLILAEHCNCCPACTVMCLPLKVIRDRGRLDESIARLYGNCKLIDE